MRMCWRRWDFTCPRVIFPIEINLGSVVVRAIGSLILANAFLLD
jgi:hypothetical protein